MEGNRINCDSSIADMGCGPAILDYGRMAVQLANVHCFTIRNTETKAMTDTLTPADLDRLQAICDAAGVSPLPWKAKYDADDGWFLWQGSNRKGQGPIVGHQHNIQLCAAAVNNFPAALATIRRLRELLERCDARLMKLGSLAECTHGGDCCEHCKLIADIRVELGKDG